MAIFRLLWLRRFVRRNTNPISEADAEIWKKRLAIGYAILAWNAFGFVGYTIYNGNADWAATHGLKSAKELAMTPGQQWAQTLGKKDAEIYRLSGFNLKKIETIKEDTSEQTQDSEK